MDSPHAPSCAHRIQIQEFQSFKKDLLRMMEAAQDRLYKHIGRYSITHVKYVNTNCVMSRLHPNQFVSQLDRQTDIRFWRK